MPADTPGGAIFNPNPEQLQSGAARRRHSIKVNNALGEKE